MSLAALRSQLALVVAPPPVAADLLPTGVAGLDAALGGGLPRGRLTEIAGPLGSGTATLARRLVTGLVARGLGVAYVDAARTLDPADWAHLAAGHLRVVRPPDAARGAWCADVLLRSGAFVLVVLDGAPPLTRQQALRLVGLAREKDAAFVVVGRDRPSAVSGAVRLALRRRWGGERRGSMERGGGTVHGANAERGADTGHGASVKRGPDTERGATTLSLRGASAASDAAIPVHRNGVPRTWPGAPFRCTGIAAAAPRPRNDGVIRILVERGGSRELVELPSALAEPCRLGVHAVGPDRRGAGRGKGKRWKGARNGGQKLPRHCEERAQRATKQSRCKERSPLDPPEDSAPMRRDCRVARCARSSQ